MRSVSYVVIGVLVLVLVHHRWSEWLIVIVRKKMIWDSIYVEDRWLGGSQFVLVNMFFSKNFD